LAFLWGARAGVVPRGRRVQASSPPTSSTGVPPSFLRPSTTSWTVVTARPIRENFPTRPTRITRSPNAKRVPTKYLPGARAASNRKSVQARSRNRKNTPTLAVPPWAKTTNDDVNTVTSPSIVAMEPYIACSRGCPAVPKQCSWRIRCGDGCFCGVPDGSSSAPTPTKNLKWTDDGAPTTVNDDVLPAWPNPSARPTRRPTPEPTIAPTARTPRPSRNGDTIEPSALPTLVPSPEPSPEPTLAPSTFLPTPWPSRTPRSRPTPIPSNSGDTSAPSRAPRRTPQPVTPQPVASQPPSAPPTPTARLYVPCRTNCPVPASQAPLCGFFQTCGNGCYCGTAPGVPSPFPTRQPTGALFSIASRPTPRPTPLPRQRVVAPPTGGSAPSAGVQQGSPGSVPAPPPASSPTGPPTIAPSNVPVAAPMPTPVAHAPSARPSTTTIVAMATAPPSGVEAGAGASSSSAGSSSGSSGSSTTNNAGLIAGVAIGVVVLLMLMGLAFATYGRKPKQDQMLELLAARLTVDRVLSMRQSERLGASPASGRASQGGFDHHDIYSSGRASEAGGRRSMADQRGSLARAGSFAQRSSFAAGPGVGGGGAFAGAARVGGPRMSVAGPGPPQGPRRASAHAVRGDPRSSFV